MNKIMTWIKKKWDNYLKRIEKETKDKIRCCK